MGLSHMTLEHVGISCRLQWGHGGTDKGGVGSTGQSPTTEIGGSMSYTSSRVMYRVRGLVAADAGILVTANCIM